MTDAETAPPAASDVNQDDESRMLLGFLQYQREHHWLQHVTTGVMEEPPTGEEAGDEEDTYDPRAAFICDWPGTDLIANYRDECRRSDEILAVTALSAAPRGLDFHPDPEYTKQITNIRWIVLHVIEETAVHSGHLEIARELLDGKTRLGGR